MDTKLLSLNPDANTQGHCVVLLALPCRLHLFSILFSSWDRDLNPRVLTQVALTVTSALLQFKSL